MKAQTRELGGAVAEGSAKAEAYAMGGSTQTDGASKGHSHARSSRRMAEGKQDGLNDAFMESALSAPAVRPTQVADGKALTSKQNVDIDLIQKLISSYFVIVRKNIQDAVPKAVMHCMVNYVQETLQRELVQELYKAEAFDDLLEESKEIAAKRQEIQEMVEALEKASHIIGEIRSFQFESDDDLV